MDKKINLSQLSDLLAQAGGMSKSASEQFVKNFFEIITQNVLSDGLVKVKGLGTFKLLQMEDRESVNVNTGERFTIEGHQKISFTPDAELKERINKPFAAFETVEITSEQADALAKMDTSDKNVQEDVPVEENEEAANTVLKEDNYSDKDVVEEKSGVADEGSCVVEDKPVVAGKETLHEEKIEATVKDVTQKKGVRFLLKFLIWVLAILLIVPLLLYLFWPLVGNRVLEFVERDIKPRDKTEIVADTAKSVVKPIKETTPVAPVQSTPSQQPAKPAETTPVQQPDKPATATPVTPVQQPAQPATPSTPAKQPAQQATSTTPVQSSRAEYSTVKLNSADAAKDLKDFTEADTVNFTMDGDLTVHTLKSGETITRLALKYYGTKKLWPYILKYNNIKDASKLQEGAKIKIPVLKSK